MFVTGISSGSVRNRTVATPSKSSSASGTPTIRRFDVLLNEQVLCYNLFEMCTAISNINTELLGGGSSPAGLAPTPFMYHRLAW